MLGVTARVSDTAGHAVGGCGDGVQAENLGKIPEKKKGPVGPFEFARNDGFSLQIRTRR